MKEYRGISVSKGIAIGKAYCYTQKIYKAEKRAIIDIAGELERLEEALRIAKEQLADLYEESLISVGEVHALIFDIHKMMLEDDDFLDMIKKGIVGGCNAEFAVYEAGNAFEETFLAMEDEYMRARAVDVKDIAGRLLHILKGISEEEMITDEPVILFADELSPSETVKIDKSKVLAFVTSKGTVNSHAAILARSMNIPSVVCSEMNITEYFQDKKVIVDGYSGEVIIEPDEKSLSMISEKMKSMEAQIQSLQMLIGKENETHDGRKIDIYANIASVEEADAAIEADAGGIGLFRSEFLYLGRTEFPTEEEQFNCYKNVAAKMQGKKVIIRTLDIGADKKAECLKLKAEENPALGYRAIRICLDRPEILITQLRAIYRASAYGNVAVMFPMIVSLDEMIQIKELVRHVKSELSKEGFTVGNVEVGIMIETPAAALISDELAKEVDFFSIGTNDLTQYTLAIDRQNEKMQHYFETPHPAVLKLMDMTVKNGHKQGIRVGICGELAADPMLTQTFLDMNVDELSVSPAEVLQLRKVVRSL